MLPAGKARALKNRGLLSEGSEIVGMPGHYEDTFNPAAFPVIKDFGKWFWIPLD